jgi:SulP family sulfate permease
MPATGVRAPARLLVAVRAMAPVAGMLHALFLLLFVLVGAKLAAWVPLPALAGVLVVVAWNMSEHGTVAALLLTFLLTVFVDLTLAIQVGMVVAAFVFMYRMSEAVQVGAGLNLVDEDEDADTEAARRTREEDARQRIGLPRGVEVFRIAGPLFFGAANRLDNLLDRLVPKPRVFILRMRMVPIIDASGVHALSNLAERCRRQGIVLVLSGLQEQPRKVLAKMGMRQNEGALYLVRDFDEARTVAERLVGTQAGGG